MTFKVGESGNKNGRPKGTGYKQQLFNSFVTPHAEKLFETAVNLALSGNEPMLRLLLERMLPPRPSDDIVSINVAAGLRNVDELLEVGECTLIELTSGNITPSQAKTIMSSIEVQRKNIETAQLEERVSSIEQNLKLRRVKAGKNARS